MVYRPYRILSKIKHFSSIKSKIKHISNPKCFNKKKKPFQKLDHSEQHLFSMRNSQHQNYFRYCWNHLCGCYYQPPPSNVQVTNDKKKNVIFGWHHFLKVIITYLTGCTVPTFSFVSCFSRQVKTFFLIGVHTRNKSVITAVTYCSPEETAVTFTHEKLWRDDISYLDSWRAFLQVRLKLLNNCVVNIRLYRSQMIVRNEVKSLKGIKQAGMFSCFSMKSLLMIHTLSTVGSTRALFFRGPWGVSPLLVPSPGPGAKQDIHCRL